MAHILVGIQYHLVVDTTNMRFYPTEHKHTAEWMKDVLNGKVNALLA